MPITYSDGVEVESFILSLIQEADRLGSSENIGKAHYHLWPVRYHLSPQRANLVRHLDWSGLDILEIGAGMGAVSRYIAEHCKRLTVVEGTAARFNVLSSRLRDLVNWDGSISNFEDVAPRPEYDVVCLFGVLEYAELYVKPLGGESPFVTMLRRANQWLKPGGAVLVAIENRLGLKYFAACGEDHTNGLFDGICGYKRGMSPRTFSRVELRDALTASGLSQIWEHYPYPDYKLPSCVLSEVILDLYGGTAVELASFDRAEDYLEPGSTLFPCSLVLESLQNQPALLKEFSNSFLFLASGSSDSPAAEKLLRASVEEGELAWHYAKSREVKTVFRQAEDGLVVEKRAHGAHLTKRYADDVVDIDWQQPPAGPVILGRKLIRELTHLAYFGQFEEFVRLIADFFTWVCDRYAIEGDPNHIQGAAFDAHPGNAFMVDAPERYALFDHEWSLRQPMTKTWLILRMLLGSDKDLTLMIFDGWGSIAELYEQLCNRVGLTPNLEEDSEFESHSASLLGGEEPLELAQLALSNRAKVRPSEMGFPRNRKELEWGGPSNFSSLRLAYEQETRERARLSEMVEELQRRHQRKIYLFPRLIDRLIVKLRG